MYFQNKNVYEYVCKSAIQIEISMGSCRPSCKVAEFVFCGLSFFLFGYFPTICPSSVYFSVPLNLQESELLWFQCPLQDFSLFHAFPFTSSPPSNACILGPFPVGLAHQGGTSEVRII